ncbi:hypothetical protein [Oscillibacter sp.]|uniref:hypothetical protein n=1 Tax=Oscillibacter sp. TaxID=1945593 RepID=UPI002633607A|nr:hypothetical protein [Oscillibacter sp.]MDD3347289.1 hypothetical protein [Oscillibacter sp.]
MFGLILWTTAEKGKRAVRIAERSCLHMRFVCAEISRTARTPEAVVRRRVSSAAKRLGKLGVNTAVLPECFAYESQLEKYGIRRASTLALRRRVAAEWVRVELAQQGKPTGSARVAVAADQLTGEAVRTITELVLRHRYVLVDLPRGGEELCRQLRRDYGVSLLLGPSKEQMEDAEALVLFSPRTELAKKNAVVLPLYDETAPLPGLSLPPALEGQLPAGADRGQLLAVLQDAGALKPGQISLASPCCLTF